MQPKTNEATPGAPDGRGPTKANEKRPGRWRLWTVGAVVALAAGAGSFAYAQERHGSAFGHGGPRDGMTGLFGGSPERIAQGADRWLDGLNATDAQRAQIKQIAVAAATDLRTQREAGRGLRARAMQILTAPTVDATAAEALRQQMSAEQERGSRRMLQAMLDMARVLTPEQRATLGQRLRERQAVMKDRMERMHRDRPSAPR